MAHDHAAVVEWVTAEARPGNTVLLMGARDPRLPALARHVLDALGGPAPSTAVHGSSRLSRDQAHVCFLDLLERFGMCCTVPQRSLAFTESREWPEGVCTQSTVSIKGGFAMNRWALRASVGLAFLFLLAWGSDAWAVGVLNCDGTESSDSLDINNHAGADDNLIFIFVAATSQLLGGPRLDPFIEVRRLSDNGFIACNDDNGNSFGGCDPLIPKM